MFFPPDWTVVHTGVAPYRPNGVREVFESSGGGVFEGEGRPVAEAYRHGKAIGGVADQVEGALAGVDPAGASAERT
ncbi:hypothetical protein [Streptomyces sannanensis]|uniref:hypothetical protein n=1 Tax=Streptomyces sannanensis TaxID=285536 RepID=UPI0031EA9E11